MEHRQQLYSPNTASTFKSSNIENTHVCVLGVGDKRIDFPNYSSQNMYRKHMGTVRIEVQQDQHTVALTLFEI